MKLIHLEIAELAAGVDSLATDHRASDADDEEDSDT